MFWTITDEDILTAQAGNDESLRRLFGQALPPCMLVASSLTGSVKQGNAVGKELVNRAIKQLERWRNPDEASRWFMHHTILLVRRLRKPIDPNDDVLVNSVGGPDVVSYRAMITALRRLPEQQQEAFILTHAQRWNVRLCAVAMDCSTTAVQTHLAEANRIIQPLVGTHFEPLTGFLNQVHKSIPIDAPPTSGMISTRIRARRSWRAMTRMVGWTVILLIIAVIVALVVLIGPRIEI